MGCLPSRLGLIHSSCPGTFLYRPRVSFQSVLFWMQDFISSFVVFVCFETKFLSLWSPGETQNLLSSLSWVLRLQVWPVILDSPSPCFSSVRWRFDESHIYFTIKIEASYTTYAENSLAVSLLNALLCHLQDAGTAVENSSANLIVLCFNISCKISVLFYLILVVWKLAVVCVYFFKIIFFFQPLISMFFVINTVILH